MSRFTKIILIFISVFSFVMLALAQEVPPAEVQEAVNLDENIQPQDLMVGEPRILPDSPFYILKRAVRGIQLAIAFNPVDKAELRLKFVNEKLIEAKKLAETKPEAVSKALENYKIETDQLKKAVEKIPIGTIQSLEVDKFMDKFVDQNLKHQKLFGKFEKELPPEVYEIIEKVKEENLAKFSDIGLKLTPPEVLQEKIVNVTETQPGSDFKQFKNLEVLQAVAEKVPEPAKPAIEQAIENSFNRLKGDLEALSPEDREKFKDYVNNIGGNETRHLAIIDEFERTELSQIVREEIEKAKQRILERVETRLKEYGTKHLEIAQKEYLDHLTTQGQMKDLRVIKEMENNLSPEVIQPVLSAKQSATTKVIETLVRAETPEQQKQFFEKIENKYYDVQQLEIFKEIEELIPPEKKELYEKLKERTLAKMTGEVERAREMKTEEKGIIIDKLAGSSPEHIKILEEVVPKPVTPEIIKQTAENIIKKAEFIEDPAKLEILKQKMEEKEIKKVVESVKPEIIPRLEERSETLMGTLDFEKAAKQMGAAKNTIEICGRTTDPLEPALRDYIRNNPPYKTLMEAAFKHLQEAEKALAEKKYGEAFGQATAATQQASNACKVVADTVMKKITENDSFNKWREFLKRLYEITPEVFPYGYDEKVIPSITILVNCVLPDLSTIKACKEAGGKVLLKADPNRCPYFECQGQVKELPCAGEGEKVNRDPAIGPVNQQCCQGLNEIGISKSYSICKKEVYGTECKADIDCPQPLCKELSSKCVEGKCLMPMCVQAVPSVKPTESAIPTGECLTGDERYYKCPDGAPVLWCKCTAEGKWDCISSPENSCPVRKTVKEIRYYKCPDGTQVKWCECSEGGCACLMSPENSCPITNQPPVTPGEECPVLKETKYYQCPDGTQISWCVCGPEGGWAGAKNKWQCQRFPENACPKPAVIPTPTIEMVGCCLSDGVCQYETKEHCSLKNGKQVSSCSPDLCPKPVATPPSTYTDYIYAGCVKEGMNKYQCPNDNTINWQCSCLVSVPEPQYRSGGYTTWTCTVEPGKFCPISSATPLVINSIQVRYYAGTLAQIFWTTNVPTDSYLEYGLTTSYGTRFSGNTIENPGGTQKVVQDLSVGFSSEKKLRPGKTYHFRITATDTKGNKFVSDDYSFDTIPECVTDTVKGQVPTEYYICPNGTSVPWCQCTSEQKWNCVSSPESACVIPVAPTPAPTATECKSGEIKQYKCSDGTLVEHCKCTAEGKWDCIVSPEKSCPVPTTNTAPSATTEKVLKLTSPNGGEKWLMGKTYDIAWNSQNVEKVNMELAVFKDNTRLGALGIDLNISAYLGKYSWQIPISQHIKDGNNFKIVIRNAETPASGISDPATLPEDESDAYFSIIE